jgi:hypothetical protein
MQSPTCCLEAQDPVRLNWKEQFRLRASLLKTADGVTLMGTEECRRCGALWYYDGRPPAGGAPEVADHHIYWYTPATPEMIARCDAVEQTLDTARERSETDRDATLADLDDEMRSARAPHSWLRLVDQGVGAEWAAIGTWEARPAAQDGQA